jgi:hypothetical protein
VDNEAENLLMNGYALKLVPQRVQKITFFAAVLSSDQTLPGAEPGSVTSPELIEALNKLDRTGLITADVDLSIAYEGDVRIILIHVQVLELEGCTVSAKDVLAVKLALPRIQDGMGRHHGGSHRPHPQQKVCDSGDWLCRVSNWFHSLGKSHHGCKGKGRQGSKESGERHHHDHHDGEHKHGDEHSGEHGADHANHGGYHRHRFNRPHHGVMRFIIHVVIPVVIGAAAGVGIGILSVFVAEIVGGVIMRVRGRRTTEYEIVDKDDDAGFDDALPVYEEGEMVPAYTEGKQ